MDIKKLHEIFLTSKGISTDTRTIQKDQLFFALKGDNFDGNKYAVQALDKGAGYAVVDDPTLINIPNCIVVKDVLESLQNLARFHRKYLNIPILGITGTNGKTTTKELINAVLSQKFKTFATQGNFNNHIGVPLTILSMDKSTEFGIVEMGANHIGEIAQLCSIANPDYGLITNIGRAHLEGFGSFEGVIKAKTELYQHIAQNGKMLFVNADDQLLMKLSGDFKKELYGKNIDAGNKFSLEKKELFLTLKWNTDKIKTQLVGNYNFYNVLAAIKTGLFFGVSKNKIIEAIENYRPKNNRSQFLDTGKNKLIVDVYNANPVSMQSAIENFYSIKASNKLLLLGDLLELGNVSADEHEKVLKLIKNLNFKNACLVGNEFYRFANDKLYPYLFFKNTDDLIGYLKKEKPENFYALLKASRGIRLEKIIPYL